MDHLINFLRRKLSPEDLADLAGEFQAAEKEEYEAAIRRVVSKLKADEKQHSFARSRLELRSQDLLRLPEGRRLTVLRNSSPVMLLVLFRQILHQSWEERFTDVKRSFELAAVGIDVAEVVAASGYLGDADVEDLRAEALAYLGNAQRINSDLVEAEHSLSKAREHLEGGTGDRNLKADLLMLEAFLRASQGRCTEAAILIEREIALRRLLGDEELLGVTLIQRGWIGCVLGEPIAPLIRFVQAGLARVSDDPRLTLQALHALAEALARDGRGSDSWGLLVLAKVPLSAVEGARFQIEHRWITGLAYRAMGESKVAERELSRVRQELASSGTTHKLPIACLDLASVHAARGDFEMVRQLAEEAHTIFKTEGLEARALAALTVLRKAAEAEQVTEGLALAVANFLARFPYNKSLRFEWKDD